VIFTSGFVTKILYAFLFKRKEDKENNIGFNEVRIKHRAYRVVFHVLHASHHWAGIFKLPCPRHNSATFFGNCWFSGGRETSTVFGCYAFLIMHLWILLINFFILIFLFANYTNASTFSKWCDGRRGRERGAHQHSSVMNAKSVGLPVLMFRGLLRNLAFNCRANFILSLIGPT
jgi:hypothetical protein